MDNSNLPEDPRLNNRTDPTNKSNKSLATQDPEELKRNNKIMKRIVIINILIYAIFFLVIRAKGNVGLDGAVLQLFALINFLIIYFVSSIIIAIIYLIKGKKPLILYYVSIAFMISAALVALLGFGMCFVSN